jgi:probable HAF family extracellular repeat protein
MEAAVKSVLTAFSRSVVLTILAASVSVTAGSAATFQGLGYLPNGTAASYASAISADGKVVVGNCWAAPGSMEAQPFRWTASAGMTTVGVESGWASRATAVSYDGSVVVGATDSRLFRWSASEGVIDLGALPGSCAGEAYGVSGDGSVVVGYSESVQGYGAFIWTADQGMSEFDELSDPTESSQACDVSSDGRSVVGWRSTADGMQAFRWTASGGIMDLAGDNWRMDQAYGISGDGSVVVGDAQGTAILWNAIDGIRPIEVNGRAFNISADGSAVVGEGLFGAGCYEAFVWTDSLGVRRLNDILAPVMPHGWSLYRATDVAVNGDLVTVVGHGINPMGRDEAWVTTFAVPEPSSMLALALGLFGLGNVPIVRRVRAIAAKAKSRG